MKPVRKTVIGAAFGALAASSVAAGAAYACHPTQQIEISAVSGAPGTAVTVQGYGFEPGGTMEVRWNASDGVVLATSGVASVQQAGLGRPQAEVRVTIPAAAAVSSEPYTIVAIQTQNSGSTVRAVKRFTVTPPPAAAPVAPEPAQDPAPSPVQQPEQPPAQLPVEPSVQPGASPEAPAAQPAPAAPVASAPRAGAGALPSTATASRPPAPVVVTPGATPAAAVPSASGDQAPVGTTPLPAAVAPSAAAPAADDLWSAVGAERAPGLLEPSAPARPEGGAPVGAVLLGFGMVTLVAIALSAGRPALARRLAARR